MRGAHYLLGATFILGVRGECNEWCTDPCTALNGHFEVECDSCREEGYLCRPGQPGFSASAHTKKGAPSKAYTHDNCRILSVGYDGEPDVRAAQAAEGYAYKKGAPSKAYTHDNCRILSVGYDGEPDVRAAQAAEGYAYKEGTPTEAYEPAPPAEHVECPVVDHDQVNRSMLLHATTPILIRGATDSWPAREAWSYESLMAHEADSVFYATRDETRTFGELLSMENTYHNGQMGQPSDCYSDGGDEEAINEHSWVPYGAQRFPPQERTLKRFDRRYSPFIAAALERGDFALPSYLAPARLLYMALGRGDGLGVTPEEHPSAWFAGVKGRKRWLFHPPNKIGPPHDVSFERGTCRPKKLYTSTSVCDQREGDIMWLPSGWWHETCSLDEYTAGVGGVTFDGADVPRSPKGVCSLGFDKEYNAYLRALSGGLHEVAEIPYCAEHKCSLLQMKRM